MENPNQKPSFYSKKPLIAPVLKNNAAILSLSEALTALNIVDSDTAMHVEKGMVKLIKQLARRGGRIVILDGRKNLVQIDIGEYERAGKPFPRIRARFDKGLQADVRETHSESIKARWDADR